MAEKLPGSQTTFKIPSDEEISILRQRTLYYPDWFQEYYYYIFVYNLFSKLNFEFSTGGMTLPTKYCTENFSEIKFVRFCPHRNIRNNFLLVTTDSGRKESVLLNMELTPDNIEDAFLRIKKLLEVL